MSRPPRTGDGPAANRRRTSDEPLTTQQRLVLLIPVVGAAVTLAGLIVAAVNSPSFGTGQLFSVLVLVLWSLLPYAGMFAVQRNEARARPSYWPGMALGCALLVGWGIWVVIGVFRRPGAVANLGFLSLPFALWLGLGMMMLLTGIVRRNARRQS